MQDLTSTGVYNVDYWTYIYERGCTDGETCTSGQRRNTGFTWYPALQVTLGENANDDNYGMHAGIAMGGIAQKSNWYFDWSGYNSSTGEALEPSKGHEINLLRERWYRVRIWKLDCVYYGLVCGWGAWVLDTVTGQDKYAGAFYLGAADMVSNSLYFNEVIEPNPCRTDILGVHNYGASYRNPGGYWAFGNGINNYEATCSDTNLYPVDRTNRYTIDDRQVFRTWPGGSLMWP